jgi:sugar O-acyltransferase (sialic acid O-acetyltransferase NeuD family)
MSAGIVIIGSKGHAISVANVAVACGYAVAAFMDDERAGRDLLGSTIVRLASLPDYERAHIAIGIGDNAVRERVAGELLANLAEDRFPALIHPSASVGIATAIGAGTVVMPNGNIGPNSQVGRFVIVNTGASLDHDGRLGDFSSLAPRAVTGGHVTIGTRSAIGIGAAIRHGVQIGDDMVIGANSYVNRDFDRPGVAYGTPCKFVRERIKGDPYL